MGEHGEVAGAGGQRERGGELARLVCSGHPNIRAAHDATLELAVDDDITSKATCVVGVSTRVVAGSPMAIAGPVELVLSVGSHRSVVHAVANPWLKSLDGGLVVRRSATRLDDTLAIDATSAAADIDRSMVDELRDPDAVLAVTVRRTPTRADHIPQLVVGRVRAQGTKGGRKATVLAAELAAADVVVADDGGASRWQQPNDSPRAAGDALQTGGRVLVIGTDELIGRCVDDLLAEVEAVRLDAFGMPATIAAAAFVGGEGPVALLPPLASKQDVEAALALSNQGVRVVTQGSAGHARRLLSTAPETVDRGVVVRDPDTPTERFERVRRDAMADAVSSKARGQIIVALAAAGPGDVPPLPPGLLTALVDRGVAPSTLAAALAGQPGWSRNHAYAVMNHPTRID